MINPHGGKLISRFFDREKFGLEENLDYNNLNSITINSNIVCDCEMIANGAFSPLKGFMNKSEIESVCENLSLLSGEVWSIPVFLPILKLDKFEVGEYVLLKNELGVEIGLVKVCESFELDLDYLCKSMFGTCDENHPGVKVVKSYSGSFVSGEIFVFEKLNINSVDLKYQLSPKQVRERFVLSGVDTVVAFQTRNPIHRAHEYIIKTAMEPYDACLIHPLIGTTKSDDISEDVRMECYEVLIEKYFNKSNTFLSTLSASMRYAGPKEAILHLIMRQNYGCSHMIIGRDHAGVGDYYGTYEAQDLVREYIDKLEIKPIFFEHAFYCKKCLNVATSKTCPHSSEDLLHLSGTKVREMLRNGVKPPREFSRDEVAEILIKSCKE